MTLSDLLKAIDDLPLKDLDKLQQRIDARRKPQSVETGDERRLRDIAEILKDAEPVELKSGTMDAEKLAAAFDAIREGLTQEERDAIADAMDFEYIEPDGDLDG
jgi:hypothetical protein